MVVREGLQRAEVLSNTNKKEKVEFPHANKRENLGSKI